MVDVGIGVDLGSSSFRIGVFDFNTERLIRSTSCDVPYYKWENKSVTQSTADILKASEACFEELDIGQYNVRSLGVGATCSFVVGKAYRNSYVPFDITGMCTCSAQQQQDIVFWMDSVAEAETDYLNGMLDEQVLNHLGGKLFSEMAIPKLLRLSQRFPDDRLSVIDLHRWTFWVLCQKLGLNASSPKSLPNSNGIAHDGELFGWADSFYKNLNLKNITIGFEDGCRDTDNEGDSCIDCYSSWFSVVTSDMIDKTLFVVAGTSTCFLYASKNSCKLIPGVWGPFKDILTNRNHIEHALNYSVYETGISCTGLLLEKLFETHPAARGHSQASLLNKLDCHTTTIEKKTKRSLHFTSRNMYFDPCSVDIISGFKSFEHSGDDVSTIHSDEDDLLLRYIVLLETLAFQIKIVVDKFRKNSFRVNDIVLTGSQAENKRLLRILQMLDTETQILLPEESASLAGIFGAFKLGKARILGKDLLCGQKYLLKVPHIYNDINSETDPTNILREKFHIYKAKSQNITR